MKLTPYDEFPVHQSPYPFSYIPSTDYSWDEGYYWGLFSPDTQVVLAAGMRLNPNTDMIGGYAMLNDKGRQFTLRFSRCWRRDFSLSVGPFTFKIVEPLKSMQLKLATNESGLSFDVTWEGVCPPYLQNHQLAESRGRRTTDQSRYSQAGLGEGWIKWEGREYSVRRDSWTGARDHSWGLYAERPPLGPPRSLLPPGQSTGPRRAMHLWILFRTPEFSGFLDYHETAEGKPCPGGDVFSGPFNGHIHKGWKAEEPIVLESVTRDFRYRKGTRVLDAATLTIIDRQGGRWILHFDIAALPWLPMTFGYTPGSWKDGGTFHTYHGSEELALEWDEIDTSVQPFRYEPYNVRGEGARDTFGFGIDYDKPVHGIEYMSRLTLTAPDGTVHKGAAQVEHFINGRYEPYGFE